MTSPNPPSAIANASRMFEFELVFPERAAQEQAEKKKLAAFGLMARYNPLNRPRDDTVLLIRYELRYEPFWHITAQRLLDYTCQVTYPVPVHNPHALRVQIQETSFDVIRQRDKARIEFVALEHCHRKVPFDAFLDGMNRAIKPETLRDYTTRYKFREVEELANPALLKPLLTLQGGIQRAKSELAREVVNATEIQRDELAFERTHLYARPVHVFEFRWASNDRVGVVEVDGLTGDVTEAGNWFADKIGQRFTRDRLIDLGAEVASLALPGGGLVIKAVAYATDPANTPRL